MGDAFARLEAQYCPPLDPALVSAILSDYDLDDDRSVENATRTLDALNESTLVEDQAGFDPSGTGAHENHELSAGRAESCPETSKSMSNETDLTSVSNGLSDLNLGGHEEIHDMSAKINVAEEDLEKLDMDTKLRLLQDIFGKHASRYNIEYTLKKSGGKWNAAMEELLNHVFFNQKEGFAEGESINAKGIDAFSEDNMMRRGRKSRAKAKRFQNIEDQRARSLPVSPVRDSTQNNKWKSASDDVEFIASRTKIPTSKISCLYNKHGASVPQTIGVLLKAQMQDSMSANGSRESDSAIFSQAQELGRDFPTVAPTYLEALIRIAHPSTAAAHELAKALTTKSRAGGIEIIPQFKAFDPASADLLQDSSSLEAQPLSPLRSPFINTQSSASQRDAYARARAAAFSQASAAHRKAKSDRLMGGAAAYYGSVGREYAALASNASAAAADDLVTSQSTPTQLDLHGVDVLNAVRIAQEKVQEWWEALGESRFNGRVGAQDRQKGYSIVVGRGSHSEGGKGKLGPAVSKALSASGWKVEAGGAVLLVRGPTR